MPSRSVFVDKDGCCAGSQLAAGAVESIPAPNILSNSIGSCTLPLNALSDGGGLDTGGGALSPTGSVGSIGPCSTGSAASVTGTVSVAVLLLQHPLPGSAPARAPCLVVVRSCALPHKHLFEGKKSGRGFVLHACARADHSASELIIFKSAAGSISFIEFRSAVSHSSHVHVLV